MARRASTVEDAFGSPIYQTSPYSSSSSARVVRNCGNCIACFNRLSTAARSFGVSHTRTSLNRNALRRLWGPTEIRSPYAVVFGETGLEVSAEPITPVRGG